MILAKEEINRYLRQILMPEISGPGQKKLLESSVLLCGETVAQLTPIVYYLAATGVGSISCRIDDPQGFEELSALIRDLNEAIALKLTLNNQGEVRAVLGGPEFILQQYKLLTTEFSPAVIGLQYGWQGGLGVLRQQEKLQPFLSELVQKYSDPGRVFDADSSGAEVIATCFLGAWSALEVVKLVLNIGEPVNDFRLFDLHCMEFPRLEPAAWGEFHPTIALPSQNTGPIDLSKRKVLIAGTGGLGSPAAYALALAGVGTIGLVDYDVVELSNLNRQFLHAASRIGTPKVASAAIALKSIMPQIRINQYRTMLTKETIFNIIAGYDLVIDAVDNFPSRFLINDACFLAGIPLIEAGVIRFDGVGMTIIPHETPCYRCMLPEPPTPGSIPACSESGVLGPVPGILGFIQAAEAVKLLTGLGKGLTGRTIFFDGLASEFLTLNLSRKDSCPLCGTNPIIHKLQEYGSAHQA